MRNKTYTPKKIKEYMESYYALIEVAGGDSVKVIIDDDEKWNIGSYSAILFRAKQIPEELQTEECKACILKLEKIVKNYQKQNKSPFKCEWNPN